MMFTHFKKVQIFKKIFLVIFVTLFSACMPTQVPTEPPVDDQPPPTPAPHLTPVIVTVKNTNGEVIDNAIVRLLGTSFTTKKITDGKYNFDGCTENGILTVSAPGYFIETTNCIVGNSEYEVFLSAIPQLDNHQYVWNSAEACKGCHLNYTIASIPRLHDEYTEWANDGHSKVFSNPYLRDTYLGTSFSGFIDPNRNLGYRLDYPSNYGNCAYCHAPSTVLNADLEVDLTPYFNQSGTVFTDGINCDVCHKVYKVNINQEGYPYPDRPGILSYELLRPNDPFNQQYFGPSSDINLEKDIHPERFSSLNISCSSVYASSQFCAPCHYGKFWDTMIYNSYGEWKNSVFGAEGKDTYQTCQDCHMVISEASSGNGCVDGQYTEFNHNMLKRDVVSGLPSMIENAASIGAKLDYKPKKDLVQVDVEVINQTVGHKFPTDSPLRHLILYIEARNANGNLLPQVSGESIPLWAGVGDPIYGEYGGRAGKIFANLLMVENSDIFPTIAYWNKTKQAWVDSDNRLLPKNYNEDVSEEHPDKSTYAFAAPESGRVDVTIKLIYRYAFIDLARQKGWDIQDDIVVAEYKDSVKVP